MTPNTEVLLRRLADHAQSLAHVAEGSCIRQDGDEFMRESTYQFYRGRASALRQIEAELREMVQGTREVP